MGAQLSPASHPAQVDTEVASPAIDGLLFGSCSLDVKVSLCKISSPELPVMRPSEFEHVYE